jgi:flagellar hook-associated protein 1 FlgK
MSTLNDILNTGRQALRVQQLAMQVVGQNTANVNTEGYSRRRIEFATAPPYEGLGHWQSNGGVDVLELGRVRDQLIDEQIRRGNAGLAYWSTRDDTLSRVEEIYSEMGGSAVSDQLQEFFAAWNDLANGPEEMGPRLAVLEKAQTLASNVRRTYSELLARRQTVDSQVQVDVEEVNHLTSQIAQLNVQIVRAETSGGEASDLRDQRDLVVDRLSKLININVRENGDGAVNVYNGGQILVQVDSTFALTAGTVSQNGLTRTVITYGESGRSVVLEGGEIKALMDLRDQDIGLAMDDLNSFALGMTARINELHRTGYGLQATNGMDFFEGDISSAADFAVSSLITDDPSRIATASTPNAPGDNSLALQIAAVQNEKIMFGGRSTLEEFYRDSVLRVGTGKAYATDQLAVEQTAMDHLETRWQSVSGVSMDEEMTHLVQVQKAYDAAAKVITTVNDMMQTLLDM